MLYYVIIICYAIVHTMASYNEVPVYCEPCDSYGGYGSTQPCCLGSIIGPCYDPDTALCRSLLTDRSSCPEGTGVCSEGSTPGPTPGPTPEPTPDRAMEPSPLTLSPTSWRPTKLPLIKPTISPTASGTKAPTATSNEECVDLQSTYECRTHARNNDCTLDIVLLNCCATCNLTYQNNMTYQNPNQISSNKGRLVEHILWSAGGIVVLSIILYLWRHRKKLQTKKSMLKTSELVLTKASKLTYIPWEDLIKEPLAGREQVVQGNFGVIRKARDFQGKELAIKMLSRSHTKEQEDHLQAEFRLASKIKPHSNVVSIFGWTRDLEKNIGIVMPYYHLGSLQSHLWGCRKDYGDISKKGVDKLNLIKDLASGIQHLHVSGIIHRDIATRNLLLYQGLYRPRLAICDFGMAICNEDVTQKFSKVRGPIKWMAPESLISGHFSEKSDVFSFGMTCYEIIEEKAPWENVSWMESMRRTKNGLHPPWSEKSNCKDAGLAISQINLEITEVWELPQDDETLRYGSSVKSLYPDTSTKSLFLSLRSLVSRAHSRRKGVKKTLWSINDTPRANLDGINKFSEDFKTYSNRHNSYRRFNSINTSNGESEDLIIITMLRKIVTNCWEKNPRLRPNINEVCHEISTIFDLGVVSSANDTYAVIHVQDKEEYKHIDILESSSEPSKEEKPDDF